MIDRTGAERPDDLLDDSIPMLTEVVPQDAPAATAQADAGRAARDAATAGEPMSGTLQLASDRVADALAAELQASLRTALAPTLHELLRDALEAPLREALANALRDAVRSTLAPALQDAARIAIEGALRDAAFRDAALRSADRGGPVGEAVPKRDGPGPVGAL